MTYTYAILHVSEAVFKEVAEKLRAAGYDHAFHDGGEVIDMHGIGLMRVAPAPNPAPDWPFPAPKPVDSEGGHPD